MLPFPELVDSLSTGAHNIAGRNRIVEDEKRDLEEEQPTPAAVDPYAVDSILRACEMMKVFRVHGEILQLRDIVARTNLHKATAFRTVHSLVLGGVLERVGKDGYRSRVQPLPSQRIRIGYASMTENSVFSRDVTDGLRRAALERGIDLVECDNRYSAKVAIRNAEMLIKENVDLAVEVQIHEQVAPIIASKFQEANIPLIAVDIPHPGAVFFGGNNYLAGRIGGHALGRWAQKRSGGKVDAAILLDLPWAGSIPAARMTGVAVGIKEILKDLADCEFVRLDGRGGYVESMDAVRKFLAKSRAERILVGAQNDASALGALRALEEAGRAENAAVVGQNATAAGRTEIRQPGTRFIGSVSFFPELYGQEIINLALEMLRGKPVPPAVFVKHLLITSENVDHYYPHDALLNVPAADTLLWNFYH
jgi:ribose transport system substrate-binding protein